MNSLEKCITLSPSLPFPGKPISPLKPGSPVGPGGPGGPSLPPSPWWDTNSHKDRLLTV